MKKMTQFAVLVLILALVLPACSPAATPTTAPVAPPTTAPTEAATAAPTEPEATAAPVNPNEADFTYVGDPNEVFDLNTYYAGSGRRAPT
jgi:ABC-type glycerol-3-phosphate transport system substrate-binding protein